MSAHDLDAVVAFFNAFIAVEAETWAYGLREDKAHRDRRKQRRILKEFFEGNPMDLVEQLDPIREPDAAWFAANRARAVGPRVMYALQTVTVDGEPMTMVYAENFEKKREGMRNRFAVAKLEGALKIVARNVMCGTCKGTGVDAVTTADCCDCNSREQGWRFAGGRELKTPTPSGNVLRLVEPTRECDKMFYHDVLV